MLHDESEEIHLTHLVPPCRKIIFSFVFSFLCFSQSYTVNAWSDTGKLLCATGRLEQRRGDPDSVGDVRIATTSTEVSLTKYDDMYFWELFVIPEYMQAGRYETNWDYGQSIWEIIFAIRRIRK